MNFSKCLEIILRHEGGFVNHPRDPGGITNLGVTARTWGDWTGKTPTVQIMRGLTQVKVAPLYKARYWDAVKGDELPAGLDLCVFDFAVNAGPGRAAKMLQRLVGVAADGKIGAYTLGAVAKHDPAALIREYQDARRDYYRSLGTFDTFGRGWLRRTDETEHAALEMAKGA